MSPKSILRLIFSCLVLASVTTLSISACTSGDSRSEVEGEMDAELDDLAGDGLDAEITDEDAESEEDTSLETEDAITADSSDEVNFDDEEDLSTSDSSSAQASSGAEMDDDEFLAEDAPSPESSVAATDDLAEGDLEKELDKGAPAGAPVAAADMGEMPMAQAEPAPGTDDMSAQMVPQAEPAPMQPPVAANGTDEFGESPIVTSKESTVGTSDIFEPVPMPVVPKEDLGVSDPLVSEVDKPLPSLKAAQEIVPVAKINRKPFFENERLMNTVYIARPGEDMQSISMKIFNEDRSAQLFADNGHLNRMVAAGEKIYYNSPNRPNDKKSIITYYEDNKLAPSYYTTEAGDDIQKIGRRVLGYEDAWKEVWAVNDSLQTQALLPAGLKVKYWSGNESKINDVASVDNMGDSEAGAEADLTKPAEGTLAQASPDDIEPPIDIPSPITPPPMPESDFASQDPMAAPINTEPVPLLPDSPSIPAVTEASKGSDSLATMAGIALVGLAGVALVAIQIKNRKKNDQGLPPSLEFTKV